MRALARKHMARLSVRFFPFRELTPFMSPMQAQLDGIEFRQKSGTTATDRARVEAEVLEHVERYLMIEEILGLDSACWPIGSEAAI